MIRLGARYADLRNAIKELQQEDFEITGFGDMSAKELAALANMKIEEATMAKERDFDEPFTYLGDNKGIQKLLDAITEKGFSVTQGRFFHILGNSDKGIAVSVLISLYKAQYGKIRTIALGDSPNDVPMLERVDSPIIVQKQGGTYDAQINLPNLIRAEGIGPEGWNKAISTLLS